MTLSGPGSGELSALKPNWKTPSEQRAKWHWWTGSDLSVKGFGSAWAYCGSEKYYGSYKNKEKYMW